MSEHRNIMHLQRAIRFNVMGKEAAELLREGYGVDSDRVLDDMSEYKRVWIDGDEPVVIPEDQA